MKILIMGLPGAGKTTLARALVPRLSAVHFNADEVRAHINRDLDFSPASRLEQARRMGWLCDRVADAGGVAIADFVCPTDETRAVFASTSDYPVLTVWCDRIKEGRFADTNAMFEKPDDFDIRVLPEGDPLYWAEQVVQHVRPTFDLTRPTALFVGRYQPFHEGHRKLIVHGIEKYGQACIAVRETMGTDDKNPFSFEYVSASIYAAMRQYEGRFVVARLPNIVSIMYGRDVGYAIESIDLDAETQKISGTDTRRRMLGG